MTRIVEYSLRCACLGSWIVQHSQFLQAHNTYYHCKQLLPTVRIDRLLAWSMYPKKVPILPDDYFVDHMKIHNTMQCRFNSFCIGDLVIIDSWSELVHQLFRRKEQEFISNFCDLAEDVKNEVQSFGRISANNLYCLYKCTIEYLVQVKSVRAIVIIDFPALCDNKPKMRNRSKQISKALLKIDQENLPFRYVCIPFRAIALHGDGYPYHFSKDTVCKYSLALDKVLIDLNLHI